MSEITASRTVVVRNPNGLHLRPLEQFAKLASQFDAKIEVISGSLRVDGSSVLNLLTLGASEGTALVLEATGPQAQVALDALAELVERVVEEEETTTEQEQSG
jgi:phosphotransferase system HPr (HPr) family protein